MTQLDPRLFVFRDDLAAAQLQDRVQAARYAEGELRQVAAPAAPIRIAPRFDAPLATEALSGELVTAYEFRDGWAWVQLRNDGYVGYTPVDCLSGMIEENTHRVSARLTYLYPAPDIKQPPITKLSFSCTVAPIGKPEGRFAELSRGGFIFADHLVGIRERARDFVRVAERFVGVPYLWGGKTTLGIDCSGLVQISLQAAGNACLRDTDMQMASAGEPTDPKNLDAIQRGDLLFWNGHVAIAQSADWMVHASGLHMEVVVEPIRRAVDRIGESHGALLAILRPQVELKTTPPEQKVAAAPSSVAAQRSPSQQPAQQMAAPKQDAGAPAAKVPGPETKIAETKIAAAVDPRGNTNAGYTAGPRAQRPAEKSAEELQAEEHKASANTVTAAQATQGQAGAPKAPAASTNPAAEKRHTEVR
ncbi:MAG: NlpC/P60 family protein [Rhodomicrobium sp.]